ncbi:T-complex protein 11-domain-containing protein [Hypoxylon argillaceum]|nr:T-complex protein 11-domain-containing protein [Hypoxylon argillaceum]
MAEDELISSLDLMEPLIQPITNPPLGKSYLARTQNHILRHEYVFEAELLFEPNLDGNKGRRKQDEATQQWALLQMDVQGLLENMAQASRDHQGPSLFALLKWVKEILLMLVTPQDGAIVNEVLDLDLLAQQMTRGNMDLGKLVPWLSDLLKQNFAPMWYETVDIVCDKLIEGTKLNSDSILAEGLVSLLSLLSSMRQDTSRLEVLYLWLCAQNVSLPKAKLIRQGLEKAVKATSKKWRSSPRMSLQPQTLSARVSQWTIFGNVMGKLIAALPDSGADACFISPETARLLGLHPQPETERRVRLANGREAVSPGSVIVPWNFRNEEATLNMTCWILPGCTHQIILGSEFLEETKCLTTLRHRIQRKYISVPKSVSVNLLGEGKQRLWGYLNDNFVAALPDTGSDVMIMSRDYARRLGLEIELGPGDIVEVEFADGATALTDGIVRDVVWASGGHSIQCDFLVLDNLSVDVILAKDYLFEMDVFSDCKEYLTEDNDIQHLDIYGIRLVRVFSDRFGPKLDQLEDNSIEDVTSQDAFSPAMINREWARRDRIRDEIEALDGNRRVQAEAAEEQRQDQWERIRVAHRQRWAQAQAPSASQPSASTTARPSTPPQGNPHATASSGASPPLGQPPPPNNVPPRFRWPKKSRVSIPLLPLRRNHSSQPPQNIP